MVLMADDWTNVGGAADKAWTFVFSCDPTEGEITIAVAYQPIVDSVQKSTDNGATWTLVTLPAASQLRCGAFSPTLNMIMLVGASGRTVRSVDGGATWVTDTVAGTPVLQFVCWDSSVGNECFIAVGFSGKIYKSTDGVVWVAKTSGTTAHLYSVIYSPFLDKLLAVTGASSSTQNYLTSDDHGDTWTLSGLGGANRSGKAAAWSEEIGMGVIVCSAGATGEARIFYSYDLEDWKESAGMDNVESYEDICWNSKQGIFVAISDGLAPNVHYSSVGYGQWKNQSTDVITSQLQSVTSTVANDLVCVASTGTGTRVERKLLSTVNIEGIISEIVINDELTMMAVSFSTGEHLATTKVEDGAYAIHMPVSSPVYLYVSANMGEAWEAGKTIEVGDKMFPIDTITTPYYYEATVGGATGGSEPTYAVSAGSFTDGGVTWAFVEKLVKPNMRGVYNPVIT